MERIETYEGDDKGKKTKKRDEDDNKQGEEEVEKIAYRDEATGDVQKEVIQKRRM